jgi:hypothetical protein
MTKICCVCKEVIDYQIEGTEKDGLISHGLCKACADIEQDNLKSLDDMSGNLQWQGWDGG